MDSGGGTALGCIFLVGIPGRRRHWQSLLGPMVLFVIAFGVTGCGTGAMLSQPLDQLDSSCRPAAGTVLAPGTYTVIVTGIAAVYTKSLPSTTVNVVHNIPLKVVVQ